VIGHILLFGFSYDDPVNMEIPIDSLGPTD